MVCPFISLIGSISYRRLTFVGHGVDLHRTGSIPRYRLLGEHLVRNMCIGDPPLVHPDIKSTSWGFDDLKPTLLSPRSVIDPASSSMSSLWHAKISTKIIVREFILSLYSMYQPIEHPSILWFRKAFLHSWKKISYTVGNFLF